MDAPQWPRQRSGVPDEPRPNTSTNEDLATGRAGSNRFLMSKSPSEKFFVGVDVGTGSARAGVFDANGNMKGSASAPVQIWKPATDFVEQSSDDIWARCCEVVRSAVAQAGIAPEALAGLGFDATCSLVVLDPEGRPVSASPSGDDRQNVIVWMDHRAVDQADRINRTGHEVLQYVGGVISPEMESPKLLWLKEHLPESWKRAGHFFDLPDFLTYRATGDIGRSLCSLVCKWTYLGHKRDAGDLAGWSDSYWQRIGLGDLVAEHYRRIGTTIRPMGAPVGGGLSEQAANELGLKAGTAVGASIIDAHAGGLGVIGAVDKGETLTPELLNSRIALIAGTSSCQMAVSQEPRFIPGVWGPYSSAMIPGLWLTEAGQSATGAALDHVIYNHGAYAEAEKQAEAEGLSIFDYLNRRLTELQKQQGVSSQSELTGELHVYPDFHGNRSPLADPTLRGMVSGLKLSSGVDDLALLYLATIQAIAYGLRHILEDMDAKGYAIRKIFACGGGLKNDVFLREHATVTGCELVLPKEPEAVLLGAAVLGAVASRTFPDILDAMKSMNAGADHIYPEKGQVADYHDRKYRVFRRMHADQMAYRQLMA
jgi:FGGY-family pentulose kinase